MQSCLRQDMQASVAVEALVRGRAARVTLSDLTANGCRIECSNGFVEDGDDIILRFGDMRVMGRVNWRDGRHARVEFRNALHAAVVAHLGFEVLPVRAALVAVADHAPQDIAVQPRSRVLRSLRDVLAFFGLPSSDAQGSPE